MAGGVFCGSFVSQAGGVMPAAQASGSGADELGSSPGRGLLRGSLPVVLGRRSAEAACARCGVARGERILANPCALAARQPDRSAVIYSNETAASSSLAGRHVDQK